MSFGYRKLDTHTGFSEGNLEIGYVEDREGVCGFNINLDVRESRYDNRTCIKLVQGLLRCRSFY